jgi:hypothetical protein
VAIRKEIYYSKILYGSGTLKTKKLVPIKFSITFSKIEIILDTKGPLLFSHSEVFSHSIDLKKSAIYTFGKI